MKRLNGTKQINLINLAKWLDNYRGMDVIIIQKLLSTINLIFPSNHKMVNGYFTSNSFVTNHVNKIYRSSLEVEKKILSYNDYIIFFVDFHLLNIVRLAYNISGLLKTFVYSKLAVD